MTLGDGDGIYRIDLCNHPAQVDAQGWNALLSRQVQPTPFLLHQNLLALHDSGSATPETGWAPLFFLVHEGSRLVAGAVTYLKAHSYGEYVFDWAWADAYRQHGLRYYPKLLAAAPFTPVPGSRLLADHPAARRALAQAMRRVVVSQKLSSAHVLFIDDEDRQALQADGWMLRHNVQFHWQQDSAAPLASFEALLAAMSHDKRKRIRQERRKVHDAGVEFEVLEGAAISESHWDFFHHCYTRTYAAHHSTPYLSRDYFARMQATMAEHWLMFTARREGRPIAASLIAIDRPRRHAWGRYWGSVEHVPCLHFEACYYQPLAWCIAEGFLRFEGGAQGEHKMARGLLPVATTSAHWLRDPRFASAVEDFLAREGAGIERYVDELREHSPFKVEPTRR